jgi:hypothetical protein
MTTFLSSQSNIPSGMIPESNANTFIQLLLVLQFQDLMVRPSEFLDYSQQHLESTAAIVRSCRLNNLSTPSGIFWDGFNKLFTDLAVRWKI